MFDKNNTVVYVGQTGNMDQRMKSHCIFVRQEDIDTSTSSRYENVIIPSDHLADIKRVKYAKVNNKYLSSIYEIQLIAKYMPIYNTQFKYYTNELIELPELKWNYYVPYSYFEGLEFYITASTRIQPTKETKIMGKNFETRLQAMKIMNELYYKNKDVNKNK